MWNKIKIFLPSIGFWIIGGGLQISGVEIPWLGFTLIGLGFVLLVIPGYQYWKSSRSKSIKKDFEKEVDKSENLPNTLTEMHRRLVELQKKKASHTIVTAKQQEDVMPSLADRLGTIKYDDWPKFKNNLKSRLHKAVPRKPKKLWSNFFVRMKWRERARVALLSESVKMKEELFNSKKWTFEDLFKISNWLDGYDWGVKKLRDNDRVWKTLFESISHYSKDEELKKLIDKHIDFSYIYNNISLIIKYSEKFKDNEFSLMLHEALIGSPISPEKAELALSEILKKIDCRMSEKDNRTRKKTPQIVNSLAMISNERIHKCSNCGFGVVVHKWDTGVVCPKCGNADNIMPDLSDFK